MVERRRVSTAFEEFNAELKRLESLDDLNQERYFPGPGRPGKLRLSAGQMHLLTEAILTRAFSKYEEFIEQVFVLYCQGRPDLSGARVGSYIVPRNAQHARAMLKAGMAFLEWNSPDKVIGRCETYLHKDSPIFLAISTHQTRLTHIRRVRNAIAHSSSEAINQFQRTVRDELGAAPLRPMSPGHFLIMTDRRAPRAQYYLRSYIGVLKAVAQIAAG